MAVKAAVRIFDLIDKGMLGNAEGMLEGILPKFPNDHTLLAAEILLLLNKGELGKCRAKAEYLSRQDVREENANKALVYALQQCCSWDALAHTYQRLKDSHNEKDTMENLFQTYVRMGAYNKAQQIAAQLQRKWPDPRYQLWVVQANLAQVPHDSVDHVLLKLSTKLVDSIIVADKGVLSTSASRMFVEILQRQGLYGDAVDFLCSKRGWRVGLPEARLEMLAVTLQLNGEKGKANAVAKQAWRRQPDNWTFVQLYLKSLSEEDQSDGLMELDGPDESKRMTVDVSDGDHTLADALRFARSLSKVVCETAAKGRVPRGPFMAELEILSLLGDVAQLREAIVAYAQRFFRLSCCYLDVSTYLDAASAEAIYAWSKKDISAKEEEGLCTHARRILGLRCHVALWGITVQEQPSHAEVEELVQKCLDAYEEARPLSVHLSCSEEGHCDGYITVVLNVMLHVYHATKDTQWIHKGLEILDAVDRRANNPTWLVFSVFFARILGMADLEACHQLDFKSIQHDTMSHIGYWPLVAGGAVDGLWQWINTAREYYGSLERDCSLLRSKVLTYMSWPAMRSVQEYECRQMNSVGRIIYMLHRIVGKFRECQTQRNLFDLMITEEKTLTYVFDALQDSRVDQLVDNTDWVAVRSMILGDIRSGKVLALSDTLAGMPSMEDRVRHARELVGSLMLLHDVALLEDYRLKMESVRNQGKKKKGGNSKILTESQSPSPPVLLCGEQPESLLVVPVMCPFVSALSDHIKTQGKGACMPHSDALELLLKDKFDITNVDAFLFPQAFILTAFLQVAPTSTFPVAAWARDLQVAVERVRGGLEKYNFVEACGSRERELREAKVSSINVILSDIYREAVGASRRR